MTIFYFQEFQIRLSGILRASCYHMPVLGTHFSYQLGCLSRTVRYLLVVTLLEISVREEGVMALYLSFQLFKKHSRLEPVPRSKPILNMKINTKKPIQFFFCFLKMNLINKLCIFGFFSFFFKIFLILFFFLGGGGGVAEMGCHKQKSFLQS